MTNFQEEAAKLLAAHHPVVMAVTGISDRAIAAFQVRTK